MGPYPAPQMEGRTMDEQQQETTTLTGDQAVVLIRRQAKKIRALEAENTSLRSSCLDLQIELSERAEAEQAVAAEESDPAQDAQDGPSE